MSRNSVLSGDIYQQIYDADVSEGDGIQAVMQGETYSAEDGYILVSEREEGTQPGRLMREVVIPAKKRRSYDLAKKLFDNYELLSNVEEVITRQERDENEELINYVIQSESMKIAREYIELRSGRSISDNAWFNRINDTWFRPFSIGSSPSRSGFEHVFLGEWKSSNNSVGGLHWWYFYYSLAQQGDIGYNGAVYRMSDPSSGLAVPELATMTFTWTVTSSSGNDTKLTKPIGGFFIGPSVAGLMAMGMVRAANDANPPSSAMLNGMDIDMRMFKSDDGRSVNTFFPVLRKVVAGVAMPPPEEEEDGNENTTNGSNVNVDSESGVGVRIVSALANPEGDDTGREKITLANVLGDGDVNLNGWKVKGPNGSELVLGNVELQQGEARTFDIPSRGSLQLSNKGGNISLLRPDGSTEQQLSYARSAARVQGAVLQWDGGDKLIVL